MLMIQTLVQFAIPIVIYAVVYLNALNAQIRVYLCFRILKTTLVLTHHPAVQENSLILFH